MASGTSHRRRGGVVILLLFVLWQRSSSSYMWRCSPYDSTNRQYYIPYFGEHEDIFQYLWQPSSFGVSYIHEISGNELNCTGVVTGISFCFTVQHSFNLSRLVEIFKFHIITEDSRDYFTVTKSMTVAVIPSQSECRETSRSDLRCCDSVNLKQQYQFNLSSNLTFGVTIPFSEGPLLHGFFEHQEMFAIMVQKIGFPIHYNKTYQRHTPTFQSLRILWFNVAIDVPTATTIDEILPTPQINDSAPSTVQQPHSSDSSSDEPTSAPTIASPSTSKTLSSSGRSSGVLAGIVLGFLIGMLVVPSAIITLLVVLFIFKRRKTKHRIAASNEVAAAAARMSDAQDAAETELSAANSMEYNAIYEVMSQNVQETSFYTRPNQAYCGVLFASASVNTDCCECKLEPCVEAQVKVKTGVTNPLKQQTGDEVDSDVGVNNIYEK